jgi:hypothetical protein
MIAVLAKIASIGFRRVLFRNRTTTALTALLTLLGFLFAWHQVDKDSAVRQAVIEYVADTEIKVLQAQIAEANRRAEIAETQAAHLAEREQVTKGELIRMNAEIAAYEAEHDIPISGRVEPSVFDRLLGN